MEAGIPPVARLRGSRGTSKPGAIYRRRIHRVPRSDCPWLGSRSSAPGNRAGCSAEDEGPVPGCRVAGTDHVLDDRAYRHTQGDLRALDEIGKDCGYLLGAAHHLGWDPGAAEERRVGVVREVVGQHVVQRARTDRARLGQRDVDAEARQLERQRLTERLERPLGGGVGSLAGEDGASTDAGDDEGSCRAALATGRRRGFVAKLTSAAALGWRPRPRVSRCTDSASTAKGPSSPKRSARSVHRPGRLLRMN